MSIYATERTRVRFPNRPFMLVLFDIRQRDESRLPIDDVVLAYDLSALALIDASDEEVHQQIAKEAIYWQYRNDPDIGALLSGTMSPIWDDHSEEGDPPPKRPILSVVDLEAFVDTQIASDVVTRWRLWDVVATLGDAQSVSYQLMQSLLQLTPRQES